MDEQELWNFFIKKLISAAEKWSAAQEGSEFGFDEFEELLHDYIWFSEFLDENILTQTFTVKPQFIQPCWERLVNSNWQWNGSNRSVLDMICEVDSRFNTVRILFV